MSTSDVKAAIEPKVYAALVGGTVGTAATKLILWGLGTVAFGASSEAVGDAAAIAAVPGSIANAVTLGVTLGCILLGGYYAKHQARAGDLVPQPATLPAEVKEFPMITSNTPKADADADGRDDTTGRFVAKGE